MRSSYWKFVRSTSFRGYPRRNFIAIKLFYATLLGFICFTSFVSLREIFSFSLSAYTDGTNHMPYKRMLTSRNMYHEKLDPINHHKRGIYFLKVHKSGSTTLQNILYRYALSKHFKVATFDMPFGMPYPDTPKAKYLFENVTVPGFRRYEMICDHAVYSEKDVSDYMTPQYDSIAIVREPFSHLQSAFSFFRLDKKFKLITEKDPLRKFLQNPLVYKNNDAFQRYLHNMQGYHFGIPQSLDDESEIQKRIEDIAKNFTVVLISNRFDESILMMKRLLNFTTKDVLYMKQFVGVKKHDTRYTDETVNAFRMIHRRISMTDYMLYNHFNDKLTSFMHNEGLSFLEELHYFQKLNQRVNEFLFEYLQIF